MTSTDTGRRPTRDEAIAAAGAWFADTLDALDALTPRQVAERAAYRRPDVDVDAVEDKVRRLRGLPPVDRTVTPSTPSTTPTADPAPAPPVVAARPRRRPATATPPAPTSSSTAASRPTSRSATRASGTTSSTSSASGRRAAGDPLAALAGLSREQALELAAAIRAEYE